MTQFKSLKKFHPSDRKVRTHNMRLRNRLADESAMSNKRAYHLLSRQDVKNLALAIYLHHQIIRHLFRADRTQNTSPSQSRTVVCHPFGHMLQIQAGHRYETYYYFVADLLRQVLCRIVKQNVLPYNDRACEAVFIFIKVYQVTVALQSTGESFNFLPWCRLLLHFPYVWADSGSSMREKACD